MKFWKRALANKGEEPHAKLWNGAHGVYGFLLHYEEILSSAHSFKNVELHTFCKSEGLLSIQTYSLLTQLLDFR